MSVQPGKYRHFRGGEYRVLFTAPYALTTLPRVAQRVFVETFEWRTSPLALRVTDRKPGSHAREVFVLEALWVGEKLPTLIDHEIVIYCDLDGVYARTETEFVETVRRFGAGDTPTRFERIGE